MDSKKTSQYYREECNKIAKFYDLGVNLLCLPFGGEKKFRKELTDFVDPKRGERVLDVGCGTGNLSFMIAERVDREGEVVGVDLSQNMISIAKEKIKRSNITFKLANAEDLPFEERRFDKVVCSLSLHEMTRTGRRNTLKEIHRVLKPSGNLYIFDVNYPKKLLTRFILRIVLKLFEGETAYNLVFKENLHEEMQESGFKMKQRKTLFLDALQMVSAKKS